MNHMPKIDRRSFLVSTAAAGGGLALGIPFGLDAADAAATPEVNAWVVVKPDETVAIRVARAEMGQGTLTGLVQMVAEELECDWSKVTYDLPSPGENVARKRVWRDYLTVGSQGIRTSQDYVRQGGAAARMMLVQAAANEWKVPAAECTVSNGVITHKASGRTTSYGKVADAAGKLEPPTEIKLKDPKDWKVIGQPKKRLDTPLKVNGEAKFGIDTRLPGMVYASIKACPVNGGTVKSYDEAKIANKPGIKKIMKVGDNAVAVVADSWWRAKTALDALPITWDEGPNAKVSNASIAAWLKEGLDADTGLIGNKTGDAKGALASAAKKYEAVYAYPYQAHCTMEPQNATALYTPDRCEVWCSTQNAEASLATTSETSGLPIAKCDVHRTFLGGGFGRRGGSQFDYVRQAVLIAKEMPGTPVKLLWSREEDMIHDWYHPITQAKLTAGFDADKNLTALHIRISGQSILAGLAPARLQEGRDPATFAGFYPGGTEAAIGYDVPNVLVDHSMRNPHLHPGFWRGVNINHNAIYLESFVDELAKEMGVDPLEFRRKNMAKHPKHLAVLNAVAEKAGWGTPAAQGIHRGIAHFHGYGSYVAAVAEVSVDGKKVRVHRIVAATDPGYAVNPSLIERQISGSFVYGLTALFLGGIDIKDGRVEQENFDTYEMMRIAQMPKVESIIMPSQGGVWGGVGEPTISVAAPAVLNAITAATGTRYRTFPLRNHGLTLV